MRPIYKNPYASRFHARLSRTEIIFAHWRIGALNSRDPKIAQSQADRLHYVLYTDAATAGGKMAAVLIVDPNGNIEGRGESASPLPAFRYRALFAH